jgi:hypothetical protein
MVLDAVCPLNMARGLRLLQQNVKEAERVLGAPLPAISHFAEEQSLELRDRIFDEFNSLAVVLRAPSASFLQDGPLSPPDDSLAGVSTVRPLQTCRTFSCLRAYCIRTARENSSLVLFRPCAQASM